MSPKKVKMIIDILFIVWTHRRQDKGSRITYGGKG
jgi:hypothetical protein